MGLKGIKRWVLFLLCLMTFGSFFIYDNPAALQTQLESVSAR